MNDERDGSVRSTLEYTIVGDNIDDIVSFTIEKYEFKNGSSLSPAVRASASTEVRDALRRKVEELKKRRIQVLAEIFSLAETTLENVVPK